jgi:hypothetical protein
MTPQREEKRVQRAIRVIPLDVVASAIAGDEAGGDALWCLVDNVASLVSVHGVGETLWDDPTIHALYVRWLQAHPERVHQTAEAALAYVRAQRGSKPEDSR